MGTPATEAMPTGYDFVRPPYKTGVERAGGGAAPPPRPDAGAAPADAPAWRPPDLGAIDELLQRLARAVRQLHTYPATSPLCAEALAACHEALVSHEGRNPITLRVTPRELLVDEVGLGAGTIIERELVHRLHHARVASLSIDCGAALRDLSHLCTDLLEFDERADTALTFAELLVEHGVDKIVAGDAHRPEVFDLGAPMPALCDIVQRERRRRDALPAAAGPVAYRYPPGKGWVRLDPAAGLDTISLVNLALLVEDPSDVATMLLRLTDDEGGEPDARGAALEKKFSEVATLFASLDARLTRVLFARLARAVLELKPERRTALLRRTILPGLLEGRVDGAVLKDFPDVDLAESLCLLLDLETAAPEVLSAALDRLDLASDRREAVVPLLRARAETPPAEAGAEAGAARHARRLVRIDAAEDRDFAAFAAFDLSIDDETEAAIGRLRGEVIDGDPLQAQLGCLSSLVRLEPNPGLVERFLLRATALLAELERASRWQELATWLTRHRELADALRKPRPDVADAITAALGAFSTPRRAAALADLHAAGGEQRAVADALADALGGSLAGACLELLDGRAAPATARALVQLMCEHASALAPELAARSANRSAHTARAIVRVLGFAGAGYERAIADQLDRQDEPTIREALRSLARIGSARAAAVVAARLRDDTAWVRGAAEEALWRFPPGEVRAQLREVLAQRDFVRRHPDSAARLLERAAQTRVDGLGAVAAALRPLAYRFWNRALVRVARAARRLADR